MGWDDGMEWQMRLASNACINRVIKVSLGADGIMTLFEYNAQYHKTSSSHSATFFTRKRKYTRNNARRNMLHVMASHDRFFAKRWGGRVGCGRGRGCIEA